MLDSAKLRAVGLAVAVAMATCVWGIATAQNDDAATVLRSACGSPNPYLVTTRFVDDLADAEPAERPVVVAFRDTVNDDVKQQVPIATYSQVGSVYGVAFDATSDSAYVGAYTRRGSLFPPGGPGAVKRIDLATGAVRHVASLPAGPSTIHSLARDQDASAAEWVGRSGLGDIEVSNDGQVLFAANLFDGRIHRLATGTGATLGSFGHGGSGALWGDQARPFGLAVRDGLVFHGVVEPLGATPGVTTPIGHVYSSDTDGTNMREVAVFPLDSLSSGEPGVSPWSSEDHPVVADLSLRANGDMLVGVRNLALDASIDGVPHRRGDVLLGTQTGDTWHIATQPEHFDDILGVIDESLTGSFAVVPGLDLLAAAGYGPYGDPASNAVVWFGMASGTQERVETLPSVPKGVQPSVLAGLGDIALACAPSQPLDPGLVATATAHSAVIGTATEIARRTDVSVRGTAAAGTQTAHAPTRNAISTVIARSTVSPATATAAAENYRLFTEGCEANDDYFVMSDLPGLPHVPTMHGREPVIAAFSRHRNQRPIVLADSASVGQVYGLAYDRQRGHLYASAFGYGHPKLGPSGQGAIYRLDLKTGAVIPWAVVDAGPPSSMTAYPPYGHLTGFGDIELDEVGTVLFAVNSYDKRIYRFSAPHGVLLGSFAHGAYDEPWGALARPFGLGFFKGWLFHGVVTPHFHKKVIIFRSRGDGTDMMEVARFDWSVGDSSAGRMAQASVSGGRSFAIPILSAPFDSRPSDPGSLQQWRRSVPIQAVTDIEFRPNGDLILGLRDRPAALGAAVLPTVREGSGWRVIEYPRHYLTDWARRKLPMAGLARHPSEDIVVSSFSGATMAYAQGAAWYDNSDGRILHSRDVYPHRGVKTAGLGDVESLCPELVSTATPTATPTLRVTPSVQPSDTPSPTTAVPLVTPSRGPTQSPTPTVVPTPLYLPLILREHCNPEYQRSDVALVIDTSSSMTGQKIADARDAALAFVGLIDLAPGRSQVAVVRYDREADVVQELTRARSSLKAAIRSLHVRSGTHIDKGLRAALEELQSVRHVERNTQVLVLLTDGVQTGAPGEELRAATEVRDAGVRVYAVGLGADVDETTLRAIAGTDERYYFAPDSGDLARIYGEIAVDLMCPGTWGRR